MKLKIMLGGILFLFSSEYTMTVDSGLTPFICHKKGEADIAISVSGKWEEVTLPDTELIGQDAITDYYFKEGTWYCVIRGGYKGPIACTTYTSNFQNIICTLNMKPFISPPNSIGSILRMLPIRAIFLYYKVLFLHASQISYRGKGILFIAPSGGGKSTQAKIWKKYRSATIVCNDRTLLRKMQGKWTTFGYPIDGSEPVCSCEVNELGCMILLKQGDTNYVQKMRPARALSKLMQQVVMDCWSSEAREKTIELLFEVIHDIPVYLFTCTPDEAAVEILEQKLIKDGVLSDG